MTDYEYEMSPPLIILWVFQKLIERAYNAENTTVQEGNLENKSITNRLGRQSVTDSQTIRQ